jgi:hypothetical protein
MPFSARTTWKLSRSQRQADAGHDVVPRPLFAARVLQLDAVDDVGVGKIAAAVEDASLVRNRDCKEVVRDPIVGQPLSIPGEDR